MLKKLLKYDLKEMFKLWWIPAITVLVLSVINGFVMIAYNGDKMLPDLVYFVVSLFSGLTTISYVIFSILSVVVIFSRFYKNFYTDEGYLTFTLPVSKASQINSKIISSTLVSWATAFVTAFSAVLSLFISEFKYIDFEELFDELSGFLEELTAFEWTMFFEGLVIAALAPIVALLFLFFCISIGSTVAKKAKVITSVAIFYGTSSVFSFVLFILLMFGIDSIDGWLVDLNGGQYSLAIDLVLLVIILLMIVVIGVLYSLQYWILDKKLNLS